jgi:hypothetical protein
MAGTILLSRRVSSICAALAPLCTVLLARNDALYGRQLIGPMRGCLTACRRSTPAGAPAERPHNPLKGGGCEHMGCATDTLAAGVRRFEEHRERLRETSNNDLLAFLRRTNRSRRVIRRAGPIACASYLLSNFGYAG